MEDKVIQQSFTFKNSDRMTAQAKKTATNIQKRKWQVKEMEEDYEHERKYRSYRQQKRHQTAVEEIVIMQSRLTA